MKMATTTGPMTGPKRIGQMSPAGTSCPAMCRRFATAGVMAEQHEAALARAEEYDLQEFCTLARGATHRPRPFTLQRDANVGAWFITLGTCKPADEAASPWTRHRGY